MSTEPFPTFSPSSIIGLLNSTIHAQKTIITAADGTLTQNTNPHNGLLLITAFFTALKLINIVSGYMGKPKDIREVVTGSFSAAKECEIVFSRVQPRLTRMGYPAEKNGASICWLCGFTINQMGEAIKYIKSEAPIWSDNAQNANAANAPECEHIVPAGAAMIYLDIPNRKRGGFEDLHYNYEWSHKFCNATASDGKKGEGVVGKSDKLFFDMLDKAGNLLTPAVNMDNIDMWLSRLAKTTIMSTLIRGNRLNVDEWMNRHKPQMINRVQEVCNYIQSRRANYPIIFGQGVQGSQLDGDPGTGTPATPFLGPPQNPVGPGLMVGDLLNLARNVSIVYNELLGKSTNLALLEAMIFSQSMLYLKTDMIMVMTAINQNRYALVTQDAFFNNHSNNGLLNGVFPGDFMRNVIAPRQQADGTVTPELTLPYIETVYQTSTAAWKSMLPLLDAKTQAEVEGRGEDDSWTYDELLAGRHIGGSGKRKKTRRNKLKQKRTRRNKNSKK